MAKVFGISTPINNDDAASRQYVDSVSGGGTVPTAAIIPYGSITPPTGYLFCDGSAVSRTTYADLFTAIGTTFGVGDGSTTFNIPDLRARMPIGTHPSGPVAIQTLGNTGGAFNHTHSSTSHSHSMTHTHSMQSHTHNFAHTHTMGSHTHTMGNHTHGLASHYHQWGGHGHGIGGLVIGNDTHAHSWTGRNAGGTGNGQPRSSDGSGTAVNETTSTDTHGHSISGSIGNVGSGNNGDGTLNSFGPSNNTSSAPSTNTTAGPNTNTTDGASSVTTGGPSQADFDSYTGNSDAATPGATDANNPPYRVLAFMIKT